MPSLSDHDLDTILATQVLIAWAGEGRCEPKRLGWWDTDLVDDDGGGDLLARLLPQTHAWAALEAVREAARRTDASARGKMAKPDALRSLYFLGFELDEQLTDRLSALKREARTPADALSLPVALDDRFSPDALTAALQHGEAAFAVVPGGRQLKGPRPESPVEMIGRLARALVPLADTYPLPFYKLEE